MKEGRRYQQLYAHFRAAGVPPVELEEAARRAVALAEQRGDRLVRHYDLYQARGIEMPTEVRSDWEHFRTNGSERPWPKNWLERL